MSIRVTIDQDVMVPMRDGVRLATDIYRPDTHEPVPVLIHRMPYSKSDKQLLHTLLLAPDDAARRGYAVVVQDVRGTFESEGTFRPYQQEQQDGHDTVEWVLNQPWCNGKLGAYGSSYMGGSALLLSLDAPDALKATVAAVSPISFRAETFVDGLFELGKNVRWAMNQAAGQMARKNLAPTEAADARKDIASHQADPWSYLRRSLNAADLVESVSEHMPFVREYLDHREDDEFWAPIDVVANAHRIAAPTLMVGGWFDPFLRSQLRLFEQLARVGPSGIRDQHRLIVGPWDHQSYLISSAVDSPGLRSFGPSARPGRAGFQDITLRWFDAFLKDDGTPSPAKRIRYFSIGPDRWDETDAWPLPKSSPSRWYVGSGGRANTADGDGVLAGQPVGSAAWDSYRYDPDDPSPSTGGRSILYYVKGGIQDQAPVQQRQDALVYTSPPLLQPLAVGGQVRAELHVRTNVPTTDLVVVLSDVDPAGVATNVVEGTYRLPDGDQTPTPTPVEVDLWDMAYTFPIGHRLRLHVTSSSFPRFERNRNVGRDAPADSSAVAIVELHHDERHPSSVTIPVLSADC